MFGLSVIVSTWFTYMNICWTITFYFLDRFKEFKEILRFDEGYCPTKQELLLRILQYDEPINCQCCCHLETSQLICCATLVINRLRYCSNQIRSYQKCWHRWKHCPVCCSCFLFSRKWFLSRPSKQRARSRLWVRVCWISRTYEE